VQFVRGDVSDHPQLPSLVRESDYVFHLAAQVGNVKSLDRPVSDADSNIVGTVRLLDAARSSTVKRIVYSSSSAIFGEAEHLPIDESHPQRPASFYALSKQTGEKYALLAASLWDLPVVCLRYFNVYGYPSEDSDYSGVIAIFFRRLAEGKPLLIYGDGEQSRDFVYVLDIVQALVRAAVLGKPGQVYNIGTGRAISITALAETIAQVANVSAEIEKLPVRPGEVRHSVADITKARKELAFEPEYDLKRGLIEYWKRVHQSSPATVERKEATAGTSKLLVLVQDAGEWQWLESFGFRQFGFEPLCVSASEPPAGLGHRHRLIRPLKTCASVPDFAQMVEVLREERPSACLSLSSGAGADLLRLAGEIASVPSFSVVASEKEFAAIPIGDAATPDVFFLASTEVLVRALSDTRYGRTLVPAGHPGHDGGAADRMLSFIRSFQQGVAEAAPKLSIVIPAFKEASNLALVCDRLLEVFAADRIPVEILIIDDASPDATYEVALRQMWKSPRIRAFTKPAPRGMGNAIRYGIDRARGSVVVITMGDGSDQVERIPDMYRKVADEGYGLVIGSRYRARENYQAIPLLYRFWSGCFRLTAWAVVGLRLSDYTNAFRAFDRRIFGRYGAESGGFEISPEITFKAWFATGRVAELDVRHLKRASGQSTFSFLRAGPGYGKILIKAFVTRLTGRWFTLDW
jgi:UDP-glucose 4-epimerase